VLFQWPAKRNNGSCHIHRYHSDAPGANLRPRSHASFDACESYDFRGDKPTPTQKHGRIHTQSLWTDCLNVGDGSDISELNFPSFPSAQGTAQKSYCSVRVEVKDD
jgi:hypothetical protein